MFSIPLYWYNPQYKRNNFFSLGIPIFPKIFSNGISGFWTVSLTVYRYERYIAGIPESNKESESLPFPQILPSYRKYVCKKEIAILGAPLPLDLDITHRYRVCMYEQQIVLENIFLGQYILSPPSPTFSVP